MSPARLRALFVVCALALGCHSSSRPAEVPDAAALAGYSVIPDAGPIPECQLDTDCTLTRMPLGSCCEVLCTPRAIGKAALAKEIAARGTCDQKCIAPLCRPESAAVVPVCVAGHCAARRNPGARH